jgi:P pilus assembly chaperone PapD
MLLPSNIAIRHCLGWTLGLACLMASPVAVAQVGLSPLVIEADAERGRAQGVLRVSNTSGEPLRVRVYAEPFTYERDTGFTTLENSSEDLTPYLQFSPRELVIAPQSERRVRLITLFPPSLPEGEYRAVIFTEPLEAQASGQTNVSIVTRVGSTMYVRQGDVDASLMADSAQWNSEQQRVDLLVVNAGTASARPKATWKIQQAGETVATGETNVASVVAGRDRNLQLALDNPLSPGTYNISGELLWRQENQAHTQSFSLSLIVP